MSAGALRELLAFDERAATSDGYGNSLGEFAEVFRCAARVRPRLGGEQVMAARLGGVQPVTITVRYDSRTAAVTPDWRARDVRSGVVYNIRSVVNPDERRRWIDMIAEKGVAI